MKMRTIITTAILLIISAGPLVSENVLQDNQETHNDCCEKSWVDNQTGMQYLERWLCFLSTVPCSNRCVIECSCGLDDICGEVSSEVVLCLRASAQGPQCYPDAMHQDRADVYTFVNSDCKTVARAHGCDCVDACQLFDCNEFSRIDDCYLICNGFLPPD